MNNILVKKLSTILGYLFERRIIEVCFPSSYPVKNKLSFSLCVTTHSCSVALVQKLKPSLSDDNKKKYMFENCQEFKSIFLMYNSKEK